MLSELVFSIWDDWVDVISHFLMNVISCLVLVLAFSPQRQLIDTIVQS